MKLERTWWMEQRGAISDIDVAPTGGEVVVGTAEGLVFLLEPDGTTRWRYALFQDIHQVRIGSNGDSAVVLLEDGSFVVFSFDGEVLNEADPVFAAATIDLRPGSNLILAGNRYGHFRQFSQVGKVLGRGEVTHPIDYISYGPKGRRAAVASSGGYVSMLGYRGEILWTSFLHRMILGIDVAADGEFILAPSREKGLVVLNYEGQGVSVYEMIHPIIAAEVSDDGAIVVALEYTGRIIHMDREARLLAAEDGGLKAKRMAISSDGHLVALAGQIAPGESVVTCMRVVDENLKKSDYLEVAAIEEQDITEDEVSIEYHIEV